MVRGPLWRTWRRISPAVQAREARLELERDEGGHAGAQAVPRHHEPPLAPLHALREPGDLGQRHAPGLLARRAAAGERAGARRKGRQAAGRAADAPYLGRPWRFGRGAWGVADVDRPLRFGRVSIIDGHATTGRVRSIKSFQT